MTESIQSILNQISQKAKSLHSMLIEERQKNAELTEKNYRLQAEIDQKSVQLQEFEREMKAQREHLANKTEQSSDSSVRSSLGRSQEIDELVKEIEYCIGQLRK